MKEDAAARRRECDISRNSRWSVHVTMYELRVESSQSLKDNWGARKIVIRCVCTVLW